MPQRITLHGLTFIEATLDLTSQRVTLHRFASMNATGALITRRNTVLHGFTSMEYSSTS